MTAGCSLTARRGTRAVPYGEQNRRSRDDGAYDCADRRKSDDERNDRRQHRLQMGVYGGMNPPDGRGFVDRFPLCTQVIGD